MLADGGRKVTCLCCLMPAMRVKLDRRGRPFLGCSGCGTMVFPRGGALATLCAAATAQLLDVQQNAAWVRAQAYGDVASQGEGALLAWLRAAPAASVSVVSASPSLPLSEAVNG